MVEVIYEGRLGNNLFQYCFGRILAENLGFKLKADPIIGFPNTGIPVNGHDYSDYPVQIITDKAVDLEAILKDKSKRKIVLYGFFQRYKYYKPYKSLIKHSWLSMDAQPKECAVPDDIVVYVRRGDCVRDGYALPFSYYNECLKNAQYGRIFICTDDPKDSFISLFKRYNAIIHYTPGNSLDDFKFMKNFNKIIISVSTFSWWAAFLSTAKEIYYPVPLKGHWSEDSEINLRVDDETRYIYIKCNEAYKLNIKEKLTIMRQDANFFMKRVRNKVIKILNGKII